MKIYATTNKYTIEDFIGKDVWVKVTNGVRFDFYNFTKYDPETDRIYYRVLSGSVFNSNGQNTPDVAAEYRDGEGHIRGSMPVWLFDNYYQLAEPFEFYTNDEMKEILFPRN